LFTVGVFDAVEFPGVDFYEIVNTTGAPVWAVSLLLFLALGIPFFFLLYLGLKILVNNLKSIGNIAKFSLLGLWLISIGVLFALGVRQAAEFSHTGSVHQEFEMPVGNTADTLVIKMKDLGFDYTKEGVRFVYMSLAFDHNGKKFLVADELHIKLSKSGNGRDSLSIWNEASRNNTLVAR